MQRGSEPERTVVKIKIYQNSAWNLVNILIWMFIIGPFQLRLVELLQLPSPWPAKWLQIQISTDLVYPRIRDTMATFNIEWIVHGYFINLIDKCMAIFLENDDQPWKSLGYLGFRCSHFQMDQQRPSTTKVPDAPILTETWGALPLAARWSFSTWPCEPWWAMRAMRAMKKTRKLCHESCEILRNQG